MKIVDRPNKRDHAEEISALMATTETGKALEIIWDDSTKFNTEHRLRAALKSRGYRLRCISRGDVLVCWAELLKPEARHGDD